MKKKLLVKILKFKNDNLWYKTKIGQEIIVKEVEDKDYYEIKLKDNNSKIIYKEDCEKIEN
tara:strand:- start:563 stop:745 length:183 start_codon:yes stop_codon:yes gene_type:complete